MEEKEPIAAGPENCREESPLQKNRIKFMEAIMNGELEIFTTFPIRHEYMDFDIDR